MSVLALGCNVRPPCKWAPSVRRKPVAGRIGGPSYVNICVPVSRSLAKSPGMPLTNINDDSCGRQHPDRGVVNSFGIYFAFFAAERAALQPMAKPFSVWA